MTTLYPPTNGTAPNTFRDNVVIWALMPFAVALVCFALAMLFVEAEMPRRGA
ncbi:hypothetical protein ACN6KF_003006 [Labrys sp. La1]|uniref:hypothetical protein n=1 Tax=Labrys sp. La1 TaxID=3404917 RepID=UPI003EBB8374